VLTDLQALAIGTTIGKNSGVVGVVSPVLAREPGVSTERAMAWSASRQWFGWESIFSYSYLNFGVKTPPMLA